MLRQVSSVPWARPGHIRRPISGVCLKFIGHGGKGIKDAAFLQGLGSVALPYSPSAVSGCHTLGMICLEWPLPSQEAVGSC